MAQQFDVVVIGAGNAGQGAAGVALQAGLSVAVIENRDVGGTCPLRGCVPKKVLVAAAETLDIIARAKAHHIDVGPDTLDWKGLIGRKEGLIENLSSSMHSSLEKRGAKVFSGAGRFVDGHTVEVDDNGRKTELVGTHIIVATGSRPRPLTFNGAEHALTSEHVLNLDVLPQSAAFVGAGVIAFEFAHVLARAGVEVTLLEVGQRPLANFDADAVATLVEATERLGVTIHTSVNVDAIEPTPQGFNVLASIDGAAQTIAVEKVFHGAGRVPNTDGLDLAAAGVSVDGRRIAVDAHLWSTTAPHIGFAGDILSGVPQLSPVATTEGRLLGKNLTAQAGGAEDVEQQSPSYAALPAAVFTVPAMAQVGLTEAAANANGRSVVAKVTDMSSWLSAKTYAEGTAFGKVVTDAETGAILGATLVGHGAQETIHAFAESIRQGLDGAAFKARPTAYPTFHSDLKHLL